MFFQQWVWKLLFQQQSGQLLEWQMNETRLEEKGLRKWGVFFYRTDSSLQLAMPLLYKTRFVLFWGTFCDTAFPSFSGDNLVRELCLHSKAWSANQLGRSRKWDSLSRRIKAMGLNTTRNWEWPGLFLPWEPLNASFGSLVGFHGACPVECPTPARPREQLCLSGSSGVWGLPPGKCPIWQVTR